MTHSIDFNKSEQYSLSIRLSTDGFSFSVYCPMAETEFYFREYPINTLRSMVANVKAFLHEVTEFDYKFRQTDILIHGANYTTLPLEAYEDEVDESVYYSNVSRRNNEIVLCNILSRSNVVVLFGMDKLIHLYLSEKFPGARFFASVSPQLEYLIATSRVGNSSKVYANLHPTSMDVLAFDRGKLLLVNSYDTPSIADRMYYLTNVWQTLGFNQEMDELWLAGIDERKILADEMMKYVRKVFHVQIPADLISGMGTADVAKIPFDLQTLRACE